MCSVMPFVAESNDIFWKNKLMANITIKMEKGRKNCHPNNLWLIIRTTHDG